MEDKRKKVIHYFRASTKKGEPLNLERHLKSAFAKSPTTESRNFNYSDAEFVSSAPENIPGGGIAGVVEVHVDNEQKAAVDKPSQNPNFSITSVAPPGGRNFTRGEVFYLVQSQHVLLIATAVRETVATRYFKELLSHTGATGIANDLVVTPVMPQDIRRRIIREGIRMIDLGVLSAKKDVKYDMRTQRSIEFREAIRAKGREFLRAVSKKATTRATVEAAEKIDMRMVISHNRSRKGAELTSDYLVTIAETLLEEDEEQSFKLVTGAEHTYSHHKLKLRKTVYLTKENESVLFASALAEMRKYLDELFADGELTK